MFHYDLYRCAELNASLIVPGDADNNGDDENEPCIKFPGEAHREVRNNYDYGRNTFFAIKHAGEV